MENTERYTYNNLARMNQDNSYINKQEIDNNSYSDYNTINFHDRYKNVQDIALSQPNIFITGVYGPDGNESHVIDSDTYLKQSELTNLNENIDLKPRYFATIPYLGKGKCEVNVESILRKGLLTNQQRSCGSGTEKTRNNIVPLIPSVENSITNPEYLVEGVADNTWVRGGSNTREQNYSLNK
jgi:hypothetical protein